MAKTNAQEYVGIQKRIPEFLAMLKAKGDYLKHNYEIKDIVDGNLLPYIEAKLKRQLTKQQSYDIAKERIPPINTLRRIIDKKSKIYAQGVLRNVVSGTEKDSDMLNWYVSAIKPNSIMQICNEYFNMFKTCLIQPYLSTAGDKRIPAIRAIPSDRFIPFSDNAQEHEKPTGYILIVGWGKPDKKGNRTMVYMAITAKEFVYFNSNGDVVTTQYVDEEYFDGVNKLGVLPYIYINRDKSCIMPTQDTDVITMTTLIPILLTDINFAHMFQAFSIFYGINVDDKGITFGPNVFWNFQSQEGNPNKPEVGTITPSSDINGGINLVANQFALWLNTLGIKPGEMGDINGSNFSSGVAKMLDEMDTSEDRKQQIPYFAQAETELWDLILNHMHKVWEPEISLKSSFSASASVEVVFAEQVPLVRRGAVVKEQNEEYKSGLTTRKRAIQTINPQMPTKEIDKLISDIDLEKSADTSTALNGAQVESMVSVLQQVGLGMIPQDSAKSILISAFGLSEDAAKAIIDPIKPNSITKDDLATANQGNQV
jgi:hypothetical protein